MTKKKGEASDRAMAFFSGKQHQQSKGSTSIAAIGKKVTFDGMPCVSAHCVHFLRLAITKCTLARDSYRHIKTCRWPFPISPLSNHDSGVDRPTQVIVKALAISTDAGNQCYVQMTTSTVRCWWDWDDG